MRSSSFAPPSTRSASGPQWGQAQVRDSAASAWRSSGRHSSAPIALSVGVGKKAMSASTMVRMPQAGCQCSGWKDVALRQIFFPTSKRPDALRSMIDGGLNG